MHRSTPLAALVSAVALVTFACIDIQIGTDDSGPRIDGSGDLLSEDFAVSGFSALEVSHAFDTEVRHGDAFTVSVTADDNVIELVRVTVSGSTLRLDLDRSPSLNNVTLRAAITMPVLTDVELSGASRADIEGFPPTDALRLDASGASAFSGKIDVDRLTMRLSGVSSAVLDGDAADAALDASGASRFELRDLKIEDCQVVLSGASSADLTVFGRLDVDLSGAARLDYYGDPRLGDVNTSGGSSMEARD